MIMRSILFAVAALALAPLAQAATLTPGPTQPEAQKAIATAQPGDTIVLSGQVGSLTLSGRTGLTIDATAAQLANLFISKSSAITVKGGQYSGDGTWAGGIYVSASRGVTLNAVRYLGRGADTAVTIRDSSGVTLADSLIERPKVGINVLTSQNVTVRGNAIFGAAIDSMDIASSQDVAVTMNTFAGAMLADDHHPDFVQMWTVKGAPKVARVTVAKNVFHGAAQGSSLFSHYDWDGGDTILVEDNTYELGYPQAIAINNSPGSIVRRNTVRTLAGSTWRASINLDATVTRCGNTVEPGAGKDGVIDAACASN